MAKFHHGAATRVEVAIAVQDTGVGIPAADLPRIFERFYRVDKALLAANGRDRFGLAYRSPNCGRHGGQIEIEASWAKTLVTFTLPIVKQEEDEAHACRLKAYYY